MEKLAGEYGDRWVWTAFAPVCKAFVAVVAGRRTLHFAKRLVAAVQVAVVGIPLFVSDQLRHYTTALLRAYGKKIPVPRPAGKRGRKPNPKLQPPPELQYAQVVKRYRKNRVVSVTTRVIFGCAEAIQARLAAGPVSRTINTAFVERSNATLRHHNSRLARKRYTFAKKADPFDQHLWFLIAYYHFVRPHHSLRQSQEQPGPRCWSPRTPAMAAGKTDHVWSLYELLTFRVPEGGDA